MTWIWGTSVIIWTHRTMGVCEHCPAAIVHWLQWPDTPNSHQCAHSAIRTGDSSTLVIRLDLRNFDCLLRGRDDWFLALAHAWHVQDLVEVLGLWGYQLFLHVLDRGDLSVCLSRNVHDLLKSPLLHLFF